jgi:predicted TIM-barrel fold metal-dependent hydrolase
MVRLRSALLPAIGLCGGLVAGPLAAPASAGVAAGPDAALQDLARLNPMDAHAHVYKNDPALLELLQRLNLRILNICVIDDRDPDFKELEPQRRQVLSVMRETSGRAAFCTTFSPYDFAEAGFSDRVNRQLDRDFSAGAIAVKIYKTIGMEITNRAGHFLQADDPVFDPIYRHIAAKRKTLVAHLAEPSTCWEPPGPANLDTGYYRKYPHEYAWLHPEYPSKAAILAARERMLAKHPQLRVVGAHLGSLETNVADIALCFEQHPNFAVDTAARVPRLMLQPGDKVRAFLIQYQDRVLYGTDFVFMPADATEAALRKYSETLERDWKYFATDERVGFQAHTIRGLKLPAKVLRKLYHDNAIRWFPGIQRDLKSR